MILTDSQYISEAMLFTYGLLVIGTGSLFIRYLRRKQK